MNLRVALLLLLLLLGIPLRQATAQQGAWSPPFKLSSDGTSWFPDIASDLTGHVHVVWSSATLFYRVWNGRVWEESNDIAAALDANGELVFDPFRASIAPDRLGSLHLFYYHLTEGLGIYSRAPLSQAGASSSWTGREVIGARENGYYTGIAADQQNRIHVVYIDRLSDSPLAELFYRRSEDGGQTWTPPLNLSDSPKVGASRPQISVDQFNTIHISWDEGWDRRSGQGTAQTSNYLFSTDGGKSWSGPIVFGKPPQLPAAQLVVTSGKDATSRLAVWRSSIDDNIYFQTSADRGVTWSDPKPIPGLYARPWNAPPFDQYALARDDGGLVHLIAVARKSPETERWIVAHAAWDGKEWSAPETLFEREGLYPEYPRLAIALGYQLHAVWFTRTELWQDGGANDVWYSNKTVGELNTPAASFPTVTAPAPTPRATIAPTKTPTPVAKPVSFSTDMPDQEIGIDAGLPMIAGISSAVVCILLAVALRKFSFPLRRK